MIKANEVERDIRNIKDWHQKIFIVPFLIDLIIMRYTTIDISDIRFRSQNIKSLHIITEKINTVCNQITYIFFYSYICNYGTI